MARNIDKFIINSPLHEEPQHFGSMTGIGSAISRLSPLPQIQSDLPRDTSDNVIPFEGVEIIRQLHDESDTGRLFNMPSF